MAAPADMLDEGKRLLAEMTLVLVLFSDASHVQFSQLKQSWRLPARMLLIGLPLSIGLGTLVTFDQPGRGDCDGAAHGCRVDANRCGARPERRHQRQCSRKTQ
jgi:hypothetical protein